MLVSHAITQDYLQGEILRRAEIPAAGGIGNARSVARIHSALACGGSMTIIDPDAVYSCLQASQ